MDRLTEGRSNINLNLNQSQHQSTNFNEEKTQTPKPESSPRSSFFSLFRRDKTKPEESVGFINRQMPAYWHGK
jgi:hypothetical protein